MRPTWTALAALALAMAMANVAHAVPAFAIQTGQPCTGCHVGGFGPQLTPFGRDFKMRGYTTRAASFNLPVSVMAIASFVHAAQDAPPPPPRHYDVNDNVTVDQVGLFLAGGLGTHLGGFVQTTYDGVARAFHWDNLDLRAVTTAKVNGVNLVLGASLNNAPTVQDAFNTLPAWGYPYTGSSLAPAPAAAPLIGLLAQNTLGVTGYVWINSSIYLEAGGYGSPGPRFLTRAGVDAYSPGSIRGTAPYARVAYQKNFGTQNIEVGAFGLWADIYPARDESAGVADYYVDTGVDASMQIYAPRNDVYTLDARYTHEEQRLAASTFLGLAQNRGDTIEDFRIAGSYFWRDRIGLTLGLFDTFGSSDPLLYAANRTLRPDSSGASVQLDGTPWGGGGSPLGARLNIKVGVQYTAYASFDGARRNYDGAGTNASDNNTVRVFTWLAY